MCQHLRSSPLRAKKEMNWINFHQKNGDKAELVLCIVGYLRGLGQKICLLLLLMNFPCLEELWWVWDGSYSKNFCGTFNFWEDSAASEEINSQARNSGKSDVLGSLINYHNQQYTLHILRRWLHRDAADQLWEAQGMKFICKQLKGWVTFSLYMVLCFGFFFPSKLEFEMKNKLIDKLLSCRI